MAFIPERLPSPDPSPRMGHSPILKPTRVIEVPPDESTPTVNLKQAATMLVDLLNKYRGNRKGA